MIFTNSVIEQSDMILSLGDYHPFWKNKSLYIPNPEFDDYSRRIMDIKENDNDAIGFFYGLINDIICKNVVICVVPSHDPEKVDSGIRTLAKMLAENGRVDGTDCLVRYKKIDKLSDGGKRSIQIHINSIKVQSTNLIKGKEILLIDDVTTTGNSLIACKRILMDNGAKKVKCLALGKTVRG